MANTTQKDVDHDEELTYWRENFTREPYYQPGHRFEYYEEAYLLGARGRAQHRGRTFEEAEPELRAEYERNRGSSPLTWEEGRHAVRAAWHRLDRIFPDSD